MKKILCILGMHDFGRWLYVKPIGRYEHKIMRKCSRCNKTESYSGTINTDKFGEVTPIKLFFI